MSDVVSSTTRVNSVVTFPTVSIPVGTYFTNGSNAMFYTEDSGLSFSNSLGINVSPIAMGSRAQTVGSLFARWRLKSGRFRYFPASATSTFGGASAVSGVFKNYQAVFGWVEDPLSAPTNFDGAVNDGMVSVSLDKPSPWIHIPSSGWKWYLPDPTAPSVYANIRNCAHGLFYGVLYAPGTSTVTQTIPFGFLNFELVWQFRGYTDRTSDSVAGTFAFDQGDLVRVGNTLTASADFVPPGPLAIARLAGGRGLFPESKQQFDKPTATSVAVPADSSESKSAESSPTAHALSAAMLAYQLRHPPLLGSTAARPILGLKGDYVLKFDENDLLDTQVTTSTVLAPKPTVPAPRKGDTEVSGCTR